MAVTTVMAIGGAETGRRHFPGRRLIEPAFWKHGQTHIQNFRRRMRQQMIDVPVQRLPTPPVAGDARLNVASAAAGVDVEAGRKIEFAQPPDPDAYVQA